MIFGITRTSPDEDAKKNKEHSSSQEGEVTNKKEVKSKHGSATSFSSYAVHRSHTGGKKKRMKEIHPRSAKKNIRIKQLHHTLISPRITEKAAELNAKGVYVFNVYPKATKNDILSAVKEYYSVTPITIRTLKRKGKKVSRRKQAGTIVGTRGMKKIAFVELKKGETISFT